VQTHPGDDWIRFQSEIHRTSIKIPATEAEPTVKADARYIRFRVDNVTGEPTIYGTMGNGRPIYAETLEAAPASWAAPADYRDDRHLSLLAEERMIGGPMERAIEDLGGLWSQGGYHPSSQPRSRQTQVGPLPPRSPSLGSLRAEEESRV
jgi:hypothetical protein